MSDKQDKLNQPVQKKEEKRGERKPQQQKKSEPTEIPVLRYRPNNNFAKFKEAFSYQALKQFGDLG